MARKSSNSGGVGILLLILLVLFVILVPIVILLAIPYFVWQNYKIKLEPKNQMSDYWLSEFQKELYRSRLADWSELYDELKVIEENMQEVHLYAQSHNLSRNMDGSYSRRSEMGKRVMNMLDELETRKKIQEEKEQEAYERFCFWKEKPQAEWKLDEYKFKEKDFLLRKIKIASIGLTFWGMMYLMFTQVYYQEPSSAMLYNALLTPIFIAILYFYHNKQNKMLEYPIPCPPEVTSDNIDDYTKSEGN